MRTIYMTTTTAGMIRVSLLYQPLFQDSTLHGVVALTLVYRARP